MVSWRKLWKTIDGIQSISDSRAQWMKRLGDCWGIAMPFMTLQPKLSDYLPHPTRDGHWLRVVEHSTEDVVGVDDETGEVLAVNRNDRSVYRIDSIRLAPMVTRLLDVKDAKVEETDIPFCSRIGTFQPLAGFAFPIYLCLIANPIGRASTIRELGQAYSGCAISPRHVLLALHTGIQVGDTFRFLTNGNLVVTRTISSLATISGDLQIGKLDSDLPGTITPAKVLPADFTAFLQFSTTLPLVCVDQESKMLVRDWTA